MRCVVVFGLLCVLAGTACQSQTEKPGELPDVERVVYDFFESIASFNYPAIRDHCADDVVLFEDGRVLRLEAFIAEVRGLEGKATISYHLEGVETHVEGALTWMSLRNRAVLVNGQGQTTREWLESAVLSKRAGLWKIVFYHSTPAREASKK